MSAHVSRVMVVWEDIQLRLLNTWISVEQGQVVISLLWSVAAKIPNDLTLYVHLILNGADDRVITEQTELPRDLHNHVVRTSNWSPNTLAITSAQLRLPSSKVAPGKYQARLFVPFSSASEHRR